MDILRREQLREQLREQFDFLRVSHVCRIMCNITVCAVPVTVISKSKSCEFKKEAYRDGIKRKGV